MAWRFELVSSVGQRGLFQRAAWLLRPEQQRLRELGLVVMKKALSTIEGSALTDEAEASASRVIRGVGLSKRWGLDVGAGFRRG